MPTATYEQLLAETLPARIETDEEYDRLHARFANLFGRRRLTPAEERLRGLLSILIQYYYYDRRILRPAQSPASRKVHAS